MPINNRPSITFRFEKDVVNLHLMHSNITKIVRNPSQKNDEDMSFESEGGTCLMIVFKTI